jgi:2-polyprenyl-6-methoxyphenol hydroxylase-like FAD-dependent oxidoreductase
MQTTEAATTDLDSCDIFVLGGGPAGSTIAALLAERGWNVVIVEKERHPRFHIGESLLPLNMPLLERLGVYDEVKRIGMPKYGAEFNSPEHGHSCHVRLQQSLGQDLSFRFRGQALCV